MSDNAPDILTRAIARNQAIVLSLPADGVLRHHKSRFLGDGQGGVLVESVPAERAVIDQLLAGHKPVAVSFKEGYDKIMFAAPVLRRVEKFRVGESVEVEALLLQPPAEIKSIQRRANYRSRVPAGAEVGVRVWRIEEWAVLRDRPLPSNEVRCKLVDLSVGGMGAIFSSRYGDPINLGTKDRLRIQLCDAEQCAILEGRIRYPEHSGTASSVRAGVQFQNLDADLPGRQAQALLTRICGELQRAEVRKLRADTLAPE